MMDHTAKISGLSTGLFSFLSGSFVMLPVQVAIIQVAVAVISGLFGLATSLAVTALRLWYEERKELRRRVENEQKRRDEREP